MFKKVFSKFSVNVRVETQLKYLTFIFRKLFQGVGATIST